MRYFTTTTAVTLLSLAASTLSSLTVSKYPGAPEGRYIVKVKDGVSKDALVEQVEQAHGEVTNNWSIINGFAGNFDTTVLNIILEDPDVEAVTEDGVATISTSGTQYDAPWGLDRISHRRPEPPNSDPTSLTYQYYYPKRSLGSGVDIYIVDTGVYVEHETFGGRARWGKTFGGYADKDGNGHGTHVAGTSAGREYGVAKQASVIAVKVLSDQGSGSYTDVMDGLQWVQQQVAATKKPSVINMSLGGPMNSALNAAVKSLTDSGIHVAVAAGNDNLPAEETSPASAETACTVGASDITDARASFSNYGPPVKIFAPGVSVTSSWIGSPTATNNISGTSMATPHITGLIAYFISVKGSMTPAAMISLIQADAQQGVLSNMITAPLTVNLLAQNAPK